MATRNPGINSPVEGKVVDIFHYIYDTFFMSIPFGCLGFLTSINSRKVVGAVFGRWWLR